MPNTYSNGLWADEMTEDCCESSRAYFQVTVYQQDGQAVPVFWSHVKETADETAKQWRAKGYHVRVNRKAFI